MGMNAGGNDGSRLPMAEINVTPLVDVMLVLLIIFMVTAPMMDQGLNLELPKSKGNPLDVPMDKQLVLKIHEDKSLRLNDKRLDLEDLKSKLRSIKSSQGDRTLFVRADKNIPYGYVAFVMGEVRGTGFQKLGLVTIPLDHEK